MAKELALPVELGDLVVEVTTGFQGTAIARTEWMNGCVRWLIVSEKLIAGELKELTADEQLVQVVKKRGKVETSSYRATVAARAKQATGGGGRSDPKMPRTPR